MPEWLPRCYAAVAVASPFSIPSVIRCAALTIRWPLASIAATASCPAPCAQLVTYPKL